MENNTLEIEIERPDEKNGVETSMENKLGSLLSVSDNKCCIYKVPEFILKGNEKFYRPLVMSFGPVYYKDAKLETMQEVKWIYLNSFLKHPNNAFPRLKPYIDFVRIKEKKIRDSYQQPSRLSSDEFVEMIVLDATFLVYHSMCLFNLAFDRPYIENKLRVLMPYLIKDLFLLENQIPYFVLKGIYEIAFRDIFIPNTFVHDILKLIGLIGIPGSKAIKNIIDGSKITDESSIEHLVDLQRMSCCLSLSVSTNKNNGTRSAANSSPSVSYIHKALSFFFPSSLCCIKLLRRNQHHLKRDEAEADGTNLIRRLCYSAKQLKDSGVTFVASSESDNPLDITFANGKLNITKLEIHDNTETYLRNLIYFEKCHHLGSSYFIDYVIFIDALVDTVEDVQVLVKNKILSNHLGSDEDVVNLFNNIGKNVPVSYEVYSDVSDALNRYASTRRNRWIAILRSKYFNHPWVILSVIAAIILFVLTLLQTVASFSNN